MAPRWWPIRLRLRFALWSGALIFLAIALYGTFVYLSMTVFLHASVRTTLGFAADQVVKTLEIEGGNLRMPDQLVEPDASGHERLRVSLLDPRGQPLMQVGPDLSLLPPVGAVPSGPVYQSLEPDLSVLTVPVRDEGRLVGAVQIAQSTEPLEQMLAQLLWVLAASLPFFVALSAWGGSFLAGRLLRPIDQMTQTARRFSVEDLSARIRLPPTDDELGRLAATFDEMLARVEDSFLRHRQFTADASHELRTPVSVIRAVLSVTRRRPRTVEEYRRALDDLETAAGRLEALVGALMTLSRADRPSPLPDETFDLQDVVTGSAESLRPLAEEKGLRLVVDLPPGLMVRGEADALIQVMVNLLGNAVRYTRTGTIAVSGRTEPTGIVVEVRDTGIGIAPEHLPRIFDRFFRADPSRSSEGTGLGLSIARSIVEHHGGQLTAESALGRGTTLRMTLPRPS